MTIASAVTVEDLRRRARRNLPKGIFEFIDGGANDERTLRANQFDFSSIGFAPRVLVDVGERRQATRILGQELSSPFVLGPAGWPGCSGPTGTPPPRGPPRPRG